MLGLLHEGGAQVRMHMHLATNFSKALRIVQMCRLHDYNPHASVYLGAIAAHKMMSRALAATLL